MLRLLWICHWYSNCNLKKWDISHKNWSWRGWFAIADIWSPELSPLTDVMSKQKVKVRGQRSSSQTSRPNLAVSGLQFEFIYGNEMMHKTWCYLGEVPYYFSRTSVKFQGDTSKEIVDLTQIWRFRTVTPVWIQWWLWNDAQSLKQNRKGVLLFFKVIHQISRLHGTKNHQFWPELSVSGM